jgi:hypothetical protein
MWELFEEFQGLLDLMDGPDPAIAAAAIVALYHSFQDIAAVRPFPPSCAAAVLGVVATSHPADARPLAVCVLAFKKLLAHSCNCRFAPLQRLLIAQWYCSGTQQRRCACRIPSRRRPHHQCLWRSATQAIGWALRSKSRTS